MESALMFPVIPKAAPASKGVVQQVMEQLGIPPHHVTTRATRIATNAYRVNVYCETAANPVVKVNDITHSFFVVVDDRGQIVYTDPKIQSLPRRRFTNGQGYPPPKLP